MIDPEIRSIRLRPEIVAVAPYRQGRQAPQSGFKLSSNENPYSPLASVVTAVGDALTQMNRYPSADGNDLRERLAQRAHVGVECVHLGSGSVALLAQFISAAAGTGDQVIYSWRSFEAYPGLVTVAGATSVQVANRPDGGHDLEAMAAAVNDRTRVIIVCTPNNPTGTVVHRDEFEVFMSRIPADCLVLLDEAYCEFVTDSDAVHGIPLLKSYPNLVVLRTFSKAYGLAGLRIGYAIGAEHILDAARAASIPLSVTDVARVGALASLEADNELQERVGTIVERRQRLTARLTAQGWSIPVSEGNFVWLATGKDTDEANEAFFAADVTVRAFPGEGIRVSVGEHESLDPLCDVAAGILSRLAPENPVIRLG